jgi:hypothetical protein
VIVNNNIKNNKVYFNIQYGDDHNIGATTGDGGNA